MSENDPATIEDRLEATTYMAQHAMMSMAALEILASIAISGRRPTDAVVANLVAARTKDPKIAVMIRSKVDDILTIAEQLAADGRSAGKRGRPSGSTGRS